MRTRTIGSLEVSIIGLGCNNFGGRIDYDASAAVVTSALDAGITFFDTADIYGGTHSEEFLGRALGSRRGEIVLATKFGMQVDAEHKGAKPDYVHSALEASLGRLQTDHVDLYQLHAPDPETPIAETLGALDECVRAGKVRQIGCSNFTVEQLQEAEAAVTSGSARFVSVQNEFSMLRRRAERDVLPECERAGVSFLPYFPLASGVLTGKYRLGHAPPAGTRLSGVKQSEGPLADDILAVVERLTEFAQSRNRNMVELAIAWIAAHKPVASVISGATSAEQVRGNVAAADWELDDDEMDQIDELLAPPARS
ncbi:MAG TPA: aldo/keto reductase [Acidimicrobiales bacterium]|nr:aldo/keto reductase [Acidimicrobiales bacterium]